MGKLRSRIVSLSRPNICRVGPGGWDVASWVFPAKTWGGIEYSRGDLSSCFAPLLC